MEKKRNLQSVKSFFMEELVRAGCSGVVGVAEFQKVYNDLMPVQRSRLEDICNRQFQSFMKNGSIICMGVAYSEYAIDCIDARLSDGTVDKDAWNIYAREYHKLNNLLNATSRDIAECFGGIVIPTTVEGIAVRNVEEYYGMTISHRAIAENAGLGWRGKNELIVNEKFSCALRFASVITNLPLINGKKVRASCGECKACLEICSFLRTKDTLENYRESCRRYINQLSLDAEVCGKCIKACYRHSIFSKRFKLR
jgi:epoxyqueuosine reductase QueG